MAEGYHLVVAQTDVDYRRPILFRPEPYDCRTWVSRIGSTSVVFESVVLDDLAGGEVLARARSSASASTTDRAARRRSPRRSASSPPDGRYSQRVDHELGGVRT